MGANMVRRLTQAGQQCVVYDLDPKVVRSLTQGGVIGTGSLPELVAGLTKPRAVWLMVPAPVISAALFGRFQSRGNGDYADRLLSAMRKQFGGHEEKK